MRITSPTTHTLRSPGTLLVWAGFASMLTMVPIVNAQNALGNGRALQKKMQTKNPNARYPSNNDNFAREMSFRESIVTGTAPGGLSFQGSTLPSRFEFRGDLGSDTIFSFRRDSLYSGLAGRGIRGTEALQYQFALTTGGQVPNSLTGMLSFARPGGDNRTNTIQGPLESRSFSTSTIGGPGPKRDFQNDNLLMPAVESGSSLIQPVRSLSNYAANRSMQPTLIGLSQNPVTHEAFGQTASPLLGVQNISLSQLRNPNPYPTSTAAPRAANPGNATPGKLVPGGTSSGRFSPGSSALPGNVPLQAGGAVKPVKTAYSELIGRYRELAGVPQDAGASTTGLPVWASDIGSVRQLLRGLPASTAQAMGITPDPESDASDNAINPPELSDEADSQRASITGRAGIDHPVPTFNAEVLSRIRDAGGMTHTLVPVNLPRIDRYAAYMQHGQTLLSQGRYFDAEESFISALSSHANDINASVGRLHAQMGAGLYLSAALNLRQMLFAHPEIAGMRYGSELLPSKARQDVIISTLIDGLDSTLSGADNGLLLAYISFQQGNREADIIRGLDALEKNGDDTAARLATMLRGVWLEPNTEKTDK